MSTLPNFLIIGPSKSGTTSLYEYLNSHPEVYMSPVKEAKFLVSESIQDRLKRKNEEADVISSLEDYVDLFSGVQNEKAIGEVSPQYFRLHNEAIEAIQEYLRDVKIIIPLRNPVDRAFSAYTHLVRDGKETLSFEESLTHEKKRMENNWGGMWAFTGNGMCYERVKAFQENFSDVTVVLLVNLKKDSETFISNLYSTLSVDPNFRPDMSVRYNVSGVPKSRKMHSLLSNPPNWVRKLSHILTPKSFREKLRRKMRDSNLDKPKLDPQTRKKLQGVFREDVKKLSALLERDLMHWVQ